MVCLLANYSCVKYPTYSPPIQLNYRSEDSTLTVNRGFEEAWTALIQYSAAIFFAIKNFEKDSGLLTLAFGSGNPIEFRLRALRRRCCQVFWTVY